MSATTATAEFGSEATSNTVSDAKVTDLPDIETEVEIFLADKQYNETRGCIFQILKFSII